ncbi:MAG: TolB-like 6-bladed beta-propeller domain-containing protein [Tannerella sp.]|jgi:hypothetical protein|nr:TolB-like 6-bladed beta-propeller domain-containing protein [Tannerella sp.]
MKTKVYFCILAALSLAACRGVDSEEAERLSLVPENLSEIETAFPGQLLLSRDYLLWTDPFHADNYVHIVGKASKKELGKMLPVGQGPDEMMHPDVAVLPGNCLLAYEVGGSKCFKLSVDSALAGKNDILERMENPHNMATRIVPVVDSTYIYCDLDKPSPFVYADGLRDSLQAFGSFPFKGEITNRWAVFQGAAAYNPARRTFVYAMFALPYMAAYVLNTEGKFEISKSRLPKTGYRVVDGKFKYDGPQAGVRELALTKDYVVTIERDRLHDATDEKRVGRNLKKLPHTVFVYDYKLKLLKIIDLGVPLIRLASNLDNNDLYFICVNPEYEIAKVSLK